VSLYTFDDCHGVVVGDLLGPDILQRKIDDETEPSYFLALFRDRLFQFVVIHDSSQLRCEFHVPGYAFKNFFTSPNAEPILM
jgi:hypothetical protein